jgi:peroxiredoxin
VLRQPILPEDHGMSLPSLLLGFALLASSDRLVVDDFACLDQRGDFQRLSRHADARFIVLYVYANDCPIVRHGAGDLRALAAEFAPRGVRFLGLDPAPQDERAAVARQSGELGLDFPILLDDSQCVAEHLGLTRTAECLLIDTQSWVLQWRGPLDDRLEYGGQKTEASRHFLREALEAALSARPMPEDAPATKGCALTFREPRATHDVDYARDIVPLLSKRCVPCHREGGIGPFAMDSHKRVSGWGAMIRDVLLTRRMTPWQVDPAFGQFRGELGLAPEEVRALVHWIEKGSPRGPGEDALGRVAEPLPEWPLGPPDLIVELPLQEIPATGLIPYRTPSVALALTEDRWVRAVDLRPTNPAVLHHAFAFIKGEQEADVLADLLERMKPENRARIEAWLEEQGGSVEDPPPEALEYFQKRAFHGIYSFFSKYAPGEGIDAFPEGTGKFLPAGASLAFQLHYTSNGVATTDQPRLGVYFHEKPPARELKVTTALNTGFQIAPHERVVPVSAERVFDHAFTLYALSPHMHYRGRSMRFTFLLPDGTREVLLSLPEYAFDWQTNYHLREPRRFPAGTRFLCEGVFDNSRWNEHNPNPDQRVRFGPRTVDEMFIGYAIYSAEE